MFLSVIFNKLVQTVLGGYPKDPAIKIALRGIVVALMVPIAVWITRKFIDRKSFISLGLALNRKTIKDLVFGFFLSVTMVAAVFTMLLFGGFLEVTSVGWSGAETGSAAGLLLWFFGIGAAVAWSEELAFRGYLLQNLEEGIGLLWAVIASCVFYGAMHISNPNSTILSGVLISLIGYVRIFGWLQTRQLWLSMGMHAGWNFSQGPLFGFHVSGLTSESLIQHQLQGPHWITGGLFGPEAGLVVVPVILLGLISMYLWTISREKVYSPQRI